MNDNRSRSQIKEDRKMELRQLGLSLRIFYTGRLAGLREKWQKEDKSE